MLRLAEVARLRAEAESESGSLGFGYWGMNEWEPLLLAVSAVDAQAVCRPPGASESAMWALGSEMSLS